MDKCKCGKKSTVICHGGIPGYYCWDCYVEMLKEINKPLP